VAKANGGGWELASGNPETWIKIKIMILGPGLNQMTPPLQPYHRFIGVIQWAVNETSECPQDVNKRGW
jgi:hypothetical protein